MALAFTLLPLGIVVASAAAAAEAADKPPPAERQSLADFAAAHPGCAALSDGCIVCRRDGAQGFACSTPGIACLPAELACRDTGGDMH